MTKDEALVLALDALEDLFGTPMNHTGGAVAVWRMDGSDAPRRAITEIKAALAQPVQPEQEPVAFLCHGNLYMWPSEDDFCGNPEDHIALFTSPPKRPWVGLTQREFEEAASGLEDLEDCWLAIEAKLKELNT